MSVSESLGCQVHSSRPRLQVGMRSSSDDSRICRWCVKQSREPSVVHLVTARPVSRAACPCVRGPQVALASIADAGLIRRCSQRRPAMHVLIPLIAVMHACICTYM